MNVKDVIKRLKRGEICVIATDTVYGLVADASNQRAVSRLYGLKQRKSKPGTIIAENIDQLVSLGIKRRYLMPVEQFWPGALSVVVPCANLNLHYLHQGKQSLAVRIPDNKTLGSILSQTGPLITSSANLPGRMPATCIKEAKRYFGDQVDFYEDGGDLSDRQSSTIIRIIDDEIEVLRQGAVKLEYEDKRG